MEITFTWLELTLIIGYPLILFFIQNYEKNKLKEKIDTNSIHIDLIKYRHIQEDFYKWKEEYKSKLDPSIFETVYSENFTYNSEKSEEKFTQRWVLENILFDRIFYKQTNQKTLQFLKDEREAYLWDRGNSWIDEIYEFKRHTISVSYDHTRFFTQNEFDSMQLHTLKETLDSKLKQANETIALQSSKVPNSKKEKKVNS